MFLLPTFGKGITRKPENFEGHHLEEVSPEHVTVLLLRWLAPGGKVTSGRVRLTVSQQPASSLEDLTRNASLKQALLYRHQPLGPLAIATASHSGEPSQWRRGREG